MKHLWEQKGGKECQLCKIGFSQLYSDKKGDKYVNDYCWNCLYKK